MKAKLLAMTFCLCLMAVSVKESVPVQIYAEPVEIMTIEQLTGLINEAVLNMYLQGEL